MISLYRNQSCTFSHVLVSIWERQVIETISLIKPMFKVNDKTTRISFKFTCFIIFVILYLLLSLKRYLPRQCQIFFVLEGVLQKQSFWSFLKNGFLKILGKLLGNYLQQSLNIAACKHEITLSHGCFPGEFSENFQENFSVGAIPDMLT